MVNYVLGVVFWRNKVLSIYKTKGPKNIRGKFNGIGGIGGKVEDHETAYEAMEREFKEETNINELDLEWHECEGFSPYKSDEYTLHVFYGRLPSENYYTYAKNTEDGDEYLKWTDYKGHELESNEEFDKHYRIYIKISKILEGNI